MLAIFKRETKSYFTGMIGYVVIGVMLAFIGLYYSANCIVYGTSDFSIVLYSTTIAMLFVLPALILRRRRIGRLLCRRVFFTLVAGLLLRRSALAGGRRLLRRFVIPCLLLGVPEGGLGNLHLTVGRISGVLRPGTASYGQKEKQCKNRNQCVSFHSVLTCCNVEMEGQFPPPPIMMVPSSGVSLFW